MEALVATLAIQVRRFKLQISANLRENFGDGFLDTTGEVLNRQAKDIDDGGRILRITSAKSRAGIRSLQVPDWFRPYLIDLASGIKPDDRIFPREKTWLHRQVVNTCKLAGVSRVVPHGLRGTHGDLALVAAATPLQVSQALGHESLTTTFRHYASPQLAEANVHQAAVAQLAPITQY